jgi:class 3 adenylate cyclase
MEPRIQYAKTADGVSIAFWTLGEGTALVIMPLLPYSHVQLESQIPEVRHWYERLARKRKVVRYDNRGSGLSEREVVGYPLDAQVLDLEAVVGRLGLDRVDLWAPFEAGPTAIAYAARHPERVSHLLLWCTYARRSDLVSPREEALVELAEKDWDLFTDTLAHERLGWSEGDKARRFAAFIRECVTPLAAGVLSSALSDVDVTNLLPDVRAPTLVLHRRRIPWLGLNLARDLASRIPDASLAVLDGASPLPFLDDVESVVQAIDDFLGEGEEAAAPVAAPSGLVTVLFTDVEGSTALTQRLGDARARDLLREHERITREALKAHGGTEVKTMGDGFMASFSSAARALECAIAMQRAFAEYSGGVGAQGLAPLRVRVGLNAGEPIAEEEDLFGTAVILAARVAAKAEGGEILASDVVRQLVAGKGFLFSDRGDVVLRGFEDPVRLYEVGWEA